VSEIERLALVVSDRLQADVTATDPREVVRAVLRALVGQAEWRLDTPEGAAIMEQRKSAYVAACRQQGCERPADQQGTCALCADIGDHIVEAWIGSVLGEPTHWP